jgi:uncharacterized protein (TIGR02391 family)
MEAINTSSAYNILENQLKKIDNKRYGIEIDASIIPETANYLKMFLGVSQQQNFLQIQYKRYEGLLSEYDILENKKQDMIAFLQGSLEYIKAHGLVESPVIEQSEINLVNLHPTVQETAGKLFSNGHYRQAILDTYIALVETVKKLSGITNLDNSPLMQRVFSQDDPIINVSEDKSEQLGFMWLFSGAVMGIRNPKAHRLINQDDPQRAIEWLSFASVLFRVLDDSKIIDIKIFYAKYGIADNKVDVTQAIVELVTNNIYEGIVVPETFKISDPFYGDQKTLVIKFRVHGQEKILSFVDGQIFKII